jgi:hypothetical protein
VVSPDAMCAFFGKIPTKCANATKLDGKSGFA